MRGHPPAPSRYWILGVTAVGGEMPIDQKIECKPAQKCEGALAQAGWNGDRCSQGAHPEKQVEDVLYHICDKADTVPVLGKGAFSCRIWVDPAANRSRI